MASPVTFEKSCKGWVGQVGFQDPYVIIIDLVIASDASTYLVHSCYRYVIFDRVNQDKGKDVKLE